MTRTHRGLPLLLIIALAPAAHSGLMVTGSTDADALANALVGSGVTISNATLIGAGGAGIPGSLGAQQGFFSGGLAAGIGIEEGVLLTTGSISNAPGPNNSDDASAELGRLGDPDLTALAGFDTFDANILSFDFTTDTGELFFRYVFASEEYNEFVGDEFNDVFAFFFDGANIAIIPGTNTPVAINNINLQTNSEWFVDNCGGEFTCTDPSFNVQYDGFTKVLTAQILGLEPNQAYSLKLAIADAGDDSFDSAVFIAGSSFSSVIPLPAATWLMLSALGLLGAHGFRRPRQSDATAHNPPGIG
jgi:hypothetical protein